MLLSFIKFISVVAYVNCYSLTDITNGVINIEDAYASATTIIPVQDSTTTMVVTIDMGIVSIDEFDEILGQISVSATLTITWTEERYRDLYGSSGIDAYGPITTDKLWTPKVYVLNAVGTLYEIPQTSEVRVHLQNGDVVWLSRVQLKGSCFSDLKYFPFDSQHCSFKFRTLGYTSTELSFSSSSSSINTDSFGENNFWKLKSTSTTSYVSSAVSLLEFKLTMERRSLYFMISTFLPIVIVSILNICVFLLPIESGERVTFSVVCVSVMVLLLGAVVYQVPPSPSSMALFIYYSVVMVFFSAAICFCAMLTIWIREGPKAKWSRSCWAGIIRCCSCKTTMTPVQRPRVSDGPEGQTNKARSRKARRQAFDWDDDASQTNDEELIRQYWGDSKSGIAWDMIFFLMFFILQTAFTVIFMAILGTEETGS